LIGRLIEEYRRCRLQNNEEYPMIESTTDVRHERDTTTLSRPEWCLIDTISISGRVQW